MTPPPHIFSGTGRHKSAIARIRLSDDTTEKLVNGLPLAQYLPTVGMQQLALAPLMLTSQLDTLGAHIKVYGGGKQGQAYAIRLGLARALVEVNNHWRKQLKDAGMLTRDARVKERKKPGLKRARRAPQFSKR